MRVLYAVLYAHNASLSFRDQYFMLELTDFFLSPNWKSQLAHLFEDDKPNS